MHNSKYLDYFEAGRMAYLAEFIAADHNWKEYGLILAKNEVNYKRPVRLSDTLAVDVCCGEIGRKSFRLDYKIHILEGEQEIECCSGSSVMVCYNYTQVASIPIPEEWRSELEKRQ